MSVETKSHALREWIESRIPDCQEAMIISCMTGEIPRASCRVVCNWKVTIVANGGQASPGRARCPTAEGASGTMDGLAALEQRQKHACCWSRDCRAAGLLF